MRSTVNGKPRWAWICAAVGVGLAAVVLMIAYIPDGDSLSPCQGSDFTGRFQVPLSETRKYDTIWPPGAECRAYGRDGRLVGARTYPAGRDWLFALVAFLIPFVGYGGYRLVARRREQPGRADARG